MQSIDTAFAKKLIKNYGTNHYAAINTYCSSIINSPNNPGVVDSRCVWYSIDQLKQFIKEIEAITYQNSPANDVELGIRFYFGEYPDDEAQLPANIPTTHAGLHTLVLVPTFHDDVNDVERDFDPSEFQSNLMPAPIDPDKTGAMVAMNNGILTPPPDVSSAFPHGLDFMIIADNS